MAYCTKCGSAMLDTAAFCGACGTPVPGSHLAGPPSYAAPFAPPPAAALAERPVSQGMAIAALLLNLLVWPGLGSLVAGEKIGWAQGFLFLFGIPLALILVGIPMLVGAWIWGIVTGVQLLQRASAQERALAAGPR